MTKLTRSDCRTISEAVTAKLAELDLGVEFDIRGGRFTADSVSFKLTASRIGEDGAAETPERIEWKRRAEYLGLDAGWLDAEFESDSGEQFRIGGIRPRSPKYCVQAFRVSDGREYKFTARQIERCMGG